MANAGKRLCAIHHLVVTFTYALFSPGTTDRLISPERKSFDIFHLESRFEFQEVQQRHVE
jgi:hypothetical protein